jgi:hypothetical protein
MTTTPTTTTPRWICRVTFLKDGKYPTKPVVHTIVAGSPDTAAARAIRQARRESLPKGSRVSHVTVAVHRAEAAS